jgi:hypothetical protein
MRNPLTSTTRHRIFRSELPRRFCQSLTFPTHRALALNRSHARSRLRRRRRQLLFRRTLIRAAHIMGPTLTALIFAGAGSAVAHAQGTMDFSGATTLMDTFKTFAVYAGAVICFGGLIFAGIRMMTGRFQDAIPGLFGALFGAAVLGWGAGWIGSLTGQQM